MDKVFYNQASASKLSWEPNWFGALFIDDDLIEKVKEWQASHGLTPDGLVGPMTYRRIWTERESDIDEYSPINYGYSQENSWIVHNSKFYPIEWPKVILWTEQGGLRTGKENYYSYTGKPDRTPTMFINHWDVCLSAESCAKVLMNRGVSIHFCIDNDGTIYQLLDTQHAAWHAGNANVNRRSIGVEISNAYYLKYQDTYLKRGFSERPILSNVKVHNTILDPFLGFYPIQIEALKTLWKSISTSLGIPLECPTNTDKSFCTTTHSKVRNGTFSGFLNHYNVTSNKIDCAGLDLPLLLQETKDTRIDRCLV